MNYSFLQEISEAYLSSNKIYNKPEMKEFLVEDVREHLQHLREEDIELYDRIWDRSKYFQTNVLKNYYNTCYLKEDFIGAMVGSLGSIIKGFGGILGSIATAAGGIFSGTLNIFGLTLTPYGILALISLLVITAMTLQGRTITKNILKMVAYLGKNMDWIGKKLSQQGRYFAFRYAIIQENYIQCYKDVGVNPEDLNYFYYLHIGSTNFPVGTKDTITKAKKLEECFMSFYIESINELSLRYFSCLRQTGDASAINNADDILKMVSGTNISSACVEYYNDMKESFDKFYDLIEFVYTDDDVNKQKQLNLLKEKLIQTKRRMSDGNRPQRYDQRKKGKVSWKDERKSR